MCVHSAVVWSFGWKTSRRSTPTSPTPSEARGATGVVKDVKICFYESNKCIKQGGIGGTCKWFNPGKFLFGNRVGASVKDFTETTVHRAISGTVKEGLLASGRNAMNLMADDERMDESYRH